MNAVLTSLSKIPGMAIPGKVTPASNERKGRPDEMRLDKIHADPNNSRRAEDENTPEGIEAQRALTADIKKRGVKAPISLRPHPKIEGEFIINFGHRRFKGALEAGLATIPYFLDVSFDSYDQVKENLLHRKPTVWALAEFVKRKLEVEKQSKGQVAEGLGKNQNAVTELVNLVNAPSCLHQAYANGVESPRTLYDLRRAYEEFPEQVDAWCDSGAKITRGTIQDLLQQLHRALATVPADEITRTENGVTGSAATSKVLRHDVKIGDPAVPEGQRDERQIDPVEMQAAGEQAATANGATVIELRHDVNEAPFALQSPAAPELRHDVKKAPESGAQKTPSVSPHTSVAAKEIMVRYMGKAAKIASNTKVRIEVDGQDAPLEVSLSELVFEWAT